MRVSTSRKLGEVEALLPGGVTRAGVGDGGNTFAPILSNQLARNSSGLGESTPRSASTTLGLAGLLAIHAFVVVPVVSLSGMFTRRMLGGVPAEPPLPAEGRGLV